MKIWTKYTLTEDANYMKIKNMQGIAPEQVYMPEHDKN